ncbi:MAG TPA: hypothetical protein VN181_00125 [Thermoanaerobaculia bacterium]|nr:hypothetical protein [Thermoanaerobaculia bacterium]
MLRFLSMSAFARDGLAASTFDAVPAVRVTGAAARGAAVFRVLVSFFFGMSSPCA